MIIVQQSWDVVNPCPHAPFQQMNASTKIRLTTGAQKSQHVLAQINHSRNTFSKHLCQRHSLVRKTFDNCSVLLLSALFFDPFRTQYHQILFFNLGVESKFC